MAITGVTISGINDNITFNPCDPGDGTREPTAPVAPDNPCQPEESNELGHKDSSIIEVFVGCLHTVLRRIGWINSELNTTSIKTSLVLQNKVSASAHRTCGIKSRIGLVCAPGVGMGILWASDEKLITLEGGFLTVS